MNVNTILRDMHSVMARSGRPRAAQRMEALRVGELRSEARAQKALRRQPQSHSLPDRVFTSRARPDWPLRWEMAEY